MPRFPDAETIECPFCSEQIYHDSERCPHCANYLFYEGADELDDSDELKQCPYCKKDIYDDAEQCPHCGNYISAEDSLDLERKPLWLILGVAACLFVVLGWILSRAP